MTILPIITLPDPLLRSSSVPIQTVDTAVIRLIDDMFETMYDAPGLGLAAVQVGVARRLLVLDVAEDGQPREPIAMINPEILSFSDERALHEEGCLSLPDVRYELERPVSLVVAYTDRTGVRIERPASGLLATAIQHEIDHLDGRLIIDYMSKLRRDMVIRKFKKIAKGED